MYRMYRFFVQILYIKKTILVQNFSIPRWGTGRVIPWAAPFQEAKHEINGDNTTHTALMETGIVSFKHGTYLLTTHLKMRGPPGRDGTGRLPRGSSGNRLTRLDSPRGAPI